METRTWTPIETTPENLTREGWSPGEWQRPRCERRPGWSIFCYQLHRRWRHPERSETVVEASAPWLEVHLDQWEIIPAADLSSLSENVWEVLTLLKEGVEFMQRAVEGRCGWDRPEIGALARWVARHARVEWTEELVRACQATELGRLIVEALPPCASGQGLAEGRDG